MTTKTCSSCKLTKALDEFHRNSSTRDGRQYACRVCAGRRVREWTARNRERARENVERWRDQNPDAARVYRDRYDLANPGVTKKAVKAWLKSHPESTREYSRIRRARIAGVAIGEVDLLALWTGLCALCGGRLDESLTHPDPMSKSIDHITPISLGGSHEQSNLQWTHLRCNVRKGARPTN